MKQGKKYFCDLCERETPNIWPQGELEVCPQCTTMIMKRSNRLLHVIQEVGKLVKSFDKGSRKAMLENPVIAEMMKLDKEFSKDMGKTYRYPRKKRSFIDFMNSITDGMESPPVEEESRDIELD